MLWVCTEVPFQIETNLRVRYSSVFRIQYRLVVFGFKFNAFLHHLAFPRESLILLSPFPFSLRLLLTVDVFQCWGDRPMHVFKNHWKDLIHVAEFFRNSKIQSWRSIASHYLSNSFLSYRFKLYTYYSYVKYMYIIIVIYIIWKWHKII
jgi:hypothetical protein